MESAADNEIYTVSRLNREARRLVESGLPPLWIEGEISNFTRHGSGHMYFSLKDENAEVRCAMFRGANRRLNFSPANGDHVILQARVTIYEVRGSFQLVAEQMEAAGEGLLRRRLEELKRKLSAEGLFAEAHKRALPPVPAAIGIITSPTGAAVRDVLQVLARRFPAARVVIYPTRVQGREATAEIAAAIECASRRAETDVLLLTRGGGSLEDLWCFNEELVARAIHACAVPIVSAVGHEIDFTIADLVADLRAPTPSAAAELITPDTAELSRTVRAADRRLSGALRRSLDGTLTRLQQLDRRMRVVHPGAVLRQLQQRADELSRQLSAAARLRVRDEATRLRQATLGLAAAAPLGRVQRALDRGDNLQRALRRAIATLAERRGNRLAMAMSNLHAVSPLATLDRGYAIVTDAAGRIVSSVRAVTPGDAIRARLADGTLAATVDAADEGD